MDESECRHSTIVQRINKARNGKRWRPAGEEAGLKTLAYCRDLHVAQLQRGRRCHHEQSANSHAPFDSEVWPWTISTPPATVKVAACSVGLKEHDGEKLLAKEWRIESSCVNMLVALEPYTCPKRHEHGQSIGSNNLWRTVK